MRRAGLTCALVLAASVAVAAVVLRREAWALEWLRHATLATTLLASGAWLFRVVRLARTRASLADPVRANAAELALAAGAMLVLLLTHDGQFKVLSDETNYVALGRTMAFDRRFEFPDRAILAQGHTHAVSFLFDKRPPLFPFVLSAVDALAGYRVANVWILNGAILGATLVLVGAVLRPRLGRPWNLCAVVWALANPIVMLTAESAGPEPLLALLWAAAGACALLVLEEPTRESVGALVATVVLLALCRLEAGPLAVAMLGAVVLASPDRKRVLAVLRGDVMLASTPVLVLPVLIQRRWLKDYFEGLTDKAFSLRYLVENLGLWGKILRDGGRVYPFSAPVLYVELAAVVVLVALVLARRTTMSRAERAAFLVVAALTGAMALVYSTYFWAQPTAPACARFYALPLFAAGLTVPAALRAIPAVKARPAAAGVAAAFAFLFAFPAAHGGAFVNQASGRVEQTMVAQYLEAQLPAKRLLLVTAMPSEYAIYDVGVMSFEAFQAGERGVLEELERRHYDEVLVLQEIKVSSGEPDAATPTPDVALETVFERQYGARRYVRLSRVKVESPPLPSR